MFSFLALWDSILRARGVHTDTNTGLGTNKQTKNQAHTEKKGRTENFLASQVRSLSANGIVCDLLLGQPVRGVRHLRNHGPTLS